MLKKLLLITGAAIAGIYLTSEEGKKAREGLLKKKNAFQPIISDLTKRAVDALEESKEINSKEVKANIELLIEEARQVILDIDLDKTVEMVQDAIRVASKKIRKAVEETEKTTAKDTSAINQITANKKTTSPSIKVSIKKHVLNQNKLDTSEDVPIKKTKSIK